MLRGLSTISFWAADLAAARTWYAEYQPPTDRGHGFITAAVVDPFGNILGIMYNPHYLEVLGSLAPR